ncbi:hypothetical protein, partial [Salmonella enterica]|uniref:hypothetical protein n=1 Tax=Salmonella enterica TaxID=28901 RepID=UPI003CF2B726
WLLDPIDLTIGSSYASVISAALETGNVTLQTTSTGVTLGGVASGGTTNATGQGDILVTSGISWSSSNALTLDAYHGVTVLSAIRGSNL